MLAALWGLGLVCLLQGPIPAMAQIDLMSGPEAVGDSEFLTPEEFAAAKDLIGTVAIEDPGKLGQHEGPNKGSKLSLGSPLDTWPQGVINFTLDSRFNDSARTAIAAGILDLTSNTCLRFQQVAAADVVGDYIQITTGLSNGCFFRGTGYTPGTGAHLLHLVLESFCAFVSTTPINPKQKKSGYGKSALIPTKETTLERAAF